MFNVPCTVVTRSMFAAGLVAALLAATSVFAQHEPPSEPPADWSPTAIDYSNVPYPHPVSYLDVRLKGEDYRFAYMDVAPVGTPNGQSVVLFHGMNFFAAAFEVTMLDTRPLSTTRTSTMRRSSASSSRIQTSPPIRPGK